MLLGVQAAAVAEPHQHAAPPLNYFYTHFHNSIRAELEALARWVGDLDVQSARRSEQDARLQAKLLELRERYRFLEQVYKYHSSVEDEVVYPALDAKVKNVTMAYRVEHQDEEMLLEQCAQLISTALTQAGEDRIETIRELICKVEEIHLTLKKHLQKEEGQLLPLLLKHFSFAEQAALVAQFLYCIPLTMVERVLTWLNPHVPQAEQEQLLQHIRSVVPDDLLLQLLTSWLQLPRPNSTSAQSAVSARSTLQAATTQSGDALLKSDKDMSSPAQGPSTGHSQSSLQQDFSGPLPKLDAVTGPGGVRPPIQEILHIHRTICSALEEFAREAHSLQEQSDVTAMQLGLLLERHRFLRSVCMFHTISEEEVMYPAVRRLTAAQPALAAPGGVGANASAACNACEKEHENEVSALEDLGRLLSDVRGFARRGRKEVAQMLQQLSLTAQQVLGSITKHMAREEAEVFPLLARHLDVAEQRTMVWQTLSAMPLRLLERVLPWVTASLSSHDTEELLNTIRLGAPAPDSALVELLSRWVDRGRCLAASGTGPACAHPPSILEFAAPLGRWPSTEDADGASQILRGMGSGDVSTQLHAGGSGALHRAGSLNGHVSAAGQMDTQDGPAAKRPRLLEPLSMGSSQQGHSGPGAAAPFHAAGQCVSTGLPRDGSRGASPMETTTTTLYPSSSWGLQTSHHAQDTSMQGVQVHEDSTTHIQLQQQPSVQQQQGQQQHGEQVAGSSSPAVTASSKQRQTIFNPIDHIFQFHQAFRQELRQLEADALNVERAILSHMQEVESRQAGGQPPSQQQSGQANDAQDALTVVTAVGLEQSSSSESQLPVAGTAATGTGTTGVRATGTEVAGATTGGTTAEATGPPGGLPCVADSHALSHKPSASGLLTGLASMVDGIDRCNTPGLSSVSTTSARPGTPGPGQASALSGAAGTASNTTSYVNRLPRRVGAAVQALDGRFQFLWGIYRAHSRSEDEIVFPALESKQALRNVSHAYTLDHQQEEQMFLDLEQVMDTLRRCDGGVSQAREATLAVRRMCAAVRASLETHIRAEEAELWPLFTEHFSPEEQQYLVGVIIGRTGAQVLQTLLPWISESFTMEEKEVMLGSLRAATKNTMFDQWLDAISAQQPLTRMDAGDVSGAAAISPVKSAKQLQTVVVTEQAMPDPELARFLSEDVTHVTPSPQAVDTQGMLGDAQQPCAGGITGNGAQQTAMQDAGHACGCTGAASPNGASGLGDNVVGVAAGPQQTSTATVESSTFRPGWEDIFRMNQKQLEAAVMRVSADPHLEPGRKAYLIQNIMVSKYIVAQQRRLRKEMQEADDGTISAAAAATGGHGTHKSTTTPAGALQGGMLGSQQGAGGEGAVMAQAGNHWCKSFNDAAHGILGCKHYRRKASLVAPCCQRVFPCRLCHDEAVSHRMDRYAVTHMLCMECGTQQPVAGSCNTCSTKLARYYCNICHLFDDEPGRHIYHCPFCNVCRRGKGLGIDFFHCMNCNACMSLTLFKSHTCREKAMESNCPVCNEYLFDSADPIKELPCGHLLHSRCFAEYTRYNYTCPLCSKSVGDMSVYFQMLDSLLASERLPPEYAGRMQQVLCNDCGKTGFARFHFAYHACPHCRSYNTRVM